MKIEKYFRFILFHFMQLDGSLKIRKSGSSFFLWDEKVFLVGEHKNKILYARSEHKLLPLLGRKKDKTVRWAVLQSSEV